MYLFDHAVIMHDKLQLISAIDLAESVWGHSFERIF